RKTTLPCFRYPMADKKTFAESSTFNDSAEIGLLRGLLMENMHNHPRGGSGSYVAPVSNLAIRYH
ncbi:hypothetical protein P7K49_029643, partial [Saguinus oedipus]